MIKKILIIAMVSVLSVGVLASCSQEATSSSEPSSSEATSSSQESETDDSSSSQAAEEAEDTHIHVNQSDYYDENGYFKDLKAADYVTIENYADIKVPAEVIAVDEGIINGEIESILANYTETNVIEDTSYVVQDGDTLNIDYVGSVDGVEFDGGSTMGMGTEVTIGITGYIDGFLSQLVGKNVGDVFDIDVTFPDDYPTTDLAGKDAVFNITINNAYEYVLPELTDDFIKEMTQGQYETAADFEAMIEESHSKSQISSYVNEQLNEIAVFSQVPESVVGYLNALTADEIEHLAMQFGITADDVANAYSFADMAAFMESQQPAIEIEAKNIVVVQYIAEELGIEVTEADIDEYFDGVDWSSYEETYGLNYIKSLVLTDLVYATFE